MSRISFQFPSHLAEQVRFHAARLDRSVGWILTTAWRLAELAILVMRCWSEEGESQPLDLFVVKRTATDRSTTSKPGPMRWEIAKRK